MGRTLNVTRMRSHRVRQSVDHITFPMRLSDERPDVVQAKFERWSFRSAEAHGVERIQCEQEFDRARDEFTIRVRHLDGPCSAVA